MIKLYISSPQASGQVDIDEDRFVVAAPPIWRKFVGHPFSDLLKWLSPLGPVIATKLPVSPKTLDKPSNLKVQS